MIVTVQNNTEMPLEVKKSCTENGMRHMWIQLNGANRPLLEAKGTQKYLRRKLRELFQTCLTSEERVLIHCAAGIHRTGTTGYTLLRWTGLEKEEALECLGKMRADTLKGVGDWRIALADEFLV